jgi:hypothetical protein
MMPVTRRKSGTPASPVSHTKPKTRGYLKLALLVCIGLYLLTVALFLRRHWPRGEAEARPVLDAPRAAILERRSALGVVDAKPEKFVTFLVCKVR